VKLSESEIKDRLSDLTDCVILHILSFLNTKDAVQTCILSPRYKDLWKRVPALVLHSTDFQTYKKFTKFVSKVLSLRDSSISLQTLDFKRDVGRLNPDILKMIVEYVVSHNVQRLGLFVVGGIAQIPPIMFSCQTITHLKLCIYNKGGHETVFPKSFNLSALTSLQLQNVEFCVGNNDRAEPFSTFNKLNSLLISNCTVSASKILCISNSTLVSLTMYNKFIDHKNYTIELSTPSLCTFSFTGNPMKLYGKDVSSLKHVDIYANANPYQKEPPLFLFSWLLEFPNIKSLTVSDSTLQVP